MTDFAVQLSGHAVEHMTLEEIFVTNVHYSREGVAV